MKPVFGRLAHDLRAERIGNENAHKLMQAYAVEACIEQAAMQCSPCIETLLEDGSIRLRVSVQE